MESLKNEARRRLQLNQEEVKKHHTEVESEMEKCEESLRNLETKYNDLIGLIHRHRDEQVSGSCLLNISVDHSSCPKLLLRLNSRHHCTSYFSTDEA